jgi:altronate dehydratase
MTQTFPFHEIARVPRPGDNVAIATQRLPQGAKVSYDRTQFELNCTILEGHRFAIHPIAPGEPLLSWGLPFGVATRSLEPGAYICNLGMLEALRVRRLDFELPPEANFEDKITPYVVDESSFQPAAQLPPYDHRRTFMGYRRTPGRGVGTRNVIILLGTSSLTAGYVRQLEARLAGRSSAYRHIDGIVAVAHTEGGDKRPNNLDLLLRTLAGFMIHPNVGAVLAVDYGSEPVTNEMLRHYLLQNGYSLADVPHHFLSLTDSFQANLAQGESIVAGWLDRVNDTTRTQESVAHLKIALQCGGSDAFSGISGNPLAAWVAKEVIRYGGYANLAETDELIGAEPYVLQKVKDLETVHKFLATVARFKERAAWHGSSAEGNPSGGNKFRGLYNIVLKSIGAAMKRHPEVRLDGVIDYGELMPGPGYYFMDSPGNDLESIAGQIASGCNMIFFVTGNGSITNFPFAPTLKIVTTTQRYELLSKEMDVNAGAYLDGTPLDQLGQQMFDLTLEIASGRLSVGEQAGHAQVQLWRDWPQTDGRNLERLLNSSPPDGHSLPIQPGEALLDVKFEATPTGRGYALDQVGLILPTSLCAGQIGRMAAEHLNRTGLGRDQHLSRFVSLMHTEGCGASSGPSEELYIRTLLGYLSHPAVKYCLLLEHGCEKTHNDYMRDRLIRLGLDPEEFGWASVQLDGGIDKVIAKIETWFAQKISETKAVRPETVGLEHLQLGLLSSGSVPATVAQNLAQLTRFVVGTGGTVVVPDQAGLLTSPAYRQNTIGQQPLQPSLAYGQQAIVPGFHLMDAPSHHWIETLTGLGATGVGLIVAYIDQQPMPGHPLIPVVQISTEESLPSSQHNDLDLILSGDPPHWPRQILQLIVRVISGEHLPRLPQQGNIDFQITRGLLGISL